MIVCSQCGTKNRDGSKFCSNCAARLAPASGLVCPMCSTPNPVETVFCNNCGARLVPLTGGAEADRRNAAAPIKGLSLPAKPSPSPTEPADGSSTEPEDEAVTKEKIEDWLTKLRATPPSEEEETPTPIEKSVPPAAPATSEPLPNWVSELPEENAAPESFSPAEPIFEDQSLPSTETRAQLPDWLKDLDAETRLPASAPQPEEQTAPPIFESAAQSEDALPDWLRAEAEAKPAPTEAIVPGISEDAGISETAEPLEAPPLQTQPAEPAVPIEPARAEEIPVWISQLKPSEAEPHAPAKPANVEGVDLEQVPDWLQASQFIPAPTPTRTPVPRMPEEILGDFETEAPLKNLRGVLPLAIAMAEPHTMLPLTSAEHQDGAHLFDEILATPQVETARVSRRRVRRGIPTMRTVIYLLVALAAIVPFFLPLNISGAMLPIAGTPAAEFFDTIQSLPADSTVLVSFDYDPSVSGEMDLLAAAIVRHLAQRRVKIIALSTLETGPLVAQRVLASTVTGANDYRYGTNYLLLGYLPGHEAGLAQLATQGLPQNGRDFGQGQLLGQYPIAANAKNMGSLALTIELAGSEDPLKIWVEQFKPRVNARIAVGASAAVEPKARAYKDAKQLVALVSGAAGAAQYEILTNQSGQAVMRLTAQSAGQIALILVVIMGNIAYWVSRVRGKR